MTVLFTSSPIIFYYFLSSFAWMPYFKEYNSSSSLFTPSVCKIPFFSQYHCYLTGYPYLKV